MYIKAILKNRQNEVFEVQVKNQCQILIPYGLVETLKFYNSLASLLTKFYKAMRKYANPNFTLIKIESDSALVVETLSKKGFSAEFNVLGVEK